MNRAIARVMPVTVVAAALAGLACESAAYNRYAHVELFNRALLYIKDCGLTEIYDFYTGANPDSVDVRVLADGQDEIMWVDVHSTTEPDEDAAQYLIDKAFAYCWNDTLEELSDPVDIESCKNCVRSIVSQFPSIALPRAGQETAFYPSRGAARSRYDFSWEVPLSMIVGLADPACDSLGNRFGVQSENSLRARVQVHTARFKSAEYLNYAIRAWNDSDCETSLRWLTRMVNYDPHHSLTAFKSSDYLTESWVSQDMDGDFDIDYQDAEQWNRGLLNYGIYYLMFCNMADNRMPSLAPGTIPLDSVDLIDWHSRMMLERATYSAGLWPMVDGLIDYFNGNAQNALDELLPKAVESAAGLLANFHEQVVRRSHPEFALVCIEGLPKDLKAAVSCTRDYGRRAYTKVDSVRGENYSCYEIPVSLGITADDCVRCDSVLGYRFKRIVVCDGLSSVESSERSVTVDRASTIHVVYSPHFQDMDGASVRERRAGGEQLGTSASGSSLEFGLSLSAGNPVDGQARAVCSVPAACRAKLELYDSVGQRVMTLLDREVPPGRHPVRVDTGGLASGVYFCRLEAAGRLAAEKLVVLR